MSGRQGFSDKGEVVRKRSVVRFLLPLPPKELSPNWRGHWAKRWRASSSYRRTCYLGTMLCDEARSNQFRRARITLTFHLGGNRRRDIDNLAASFKAGLDGIVDTGLIGGDDSAVLEHGAPRIKNVGNKAEEGVLVEIMELEE